MAAERIGRSPTVRNPFVGSTTASSVQGPNPAARCNNIDRAMGRVGPRQRCKLDPIYFNVGGDPSMALAVTTQAMQSLGYRITPNQDGWSGRAQVGSKAARALAGGFSRRMVVDFSVAQNGPGLVVTIAPAVSGWSGGALGASKVKKELAGLQQAVGSNLQQAGMLA